MANWFHKFTGVTSERIIQLKAAANDLVVEKGKPEMRHLLYLVAIGFGVAYWAGLLAQNILELPPVLTKGTYKILLVTTFGLGGASCPSGHAHSVFLNS